MNRWLALPLVLGLAGCADRQDESLTEPLPASQAARCVVAAAPGGNGGHGGMFALLVAGALPDLVLDASGGLGAPPGTFQHGPAALQGESGDSGVVEITQEPAYVFDASGIEPGTRLAVGVNGENVLVVSGTDAMPVVRVERFELGEGAVLGLSRFSRIEADELVIAKGARLVLRDGGVSSMTIGESELEEPGLSGGQVDIVARRLVLDGIIDASGSDGLPGQAGGHGGQLSIASETVELGADANILVNGGNGGAGDDERACVNE